MTEKLILKASISDKGLCRDVSGPKNMLDMHVVGDYVVGDYADGEILKS